MDEEEYRPEGRGRSAKKRAVQEIAKLAERAAGLPDAAVNSLSLDEPVLAALMQLRQTKPRGARKRALKYFAGKLRGDEEARQELQTAMSRLDGASHQDTANHKDLERLRERLCSVDEHDAAMAVVAADYPTVDSQILLRLIKSARHRNSKRDFREIFRLLRVGKETQ